MLCPEVLTFEPKSSKTSVVVLDNVKKASVKRDEIFDQMKICIPGSLHAPENLKDFLSDDTIFYKVEKKFPFELLVDEQFLETFVRKGKLFLQTSSDPYHFLCILPSGWLFIGADRYSVDGLGFEAGIVRKSKDGKVLLGLKLTQVAARQKMLRHLSKFLGCQNFGGSLQFASPVKFSWFPTDPKVCPSTLAKYFVDNGVDVEEVFAEFDVFRFSPPLELIPTFCFDDNDDFSMEDFENWVGAAFYQIQSFSDDDNPSFTSKVNCKSVLCLNVKGLFDHNIVNGTINLLSKYLQSKPDIPWVSVTCRHPTVVAKTSTKNRQLIHKTFVIFKNGKVVSSVSKF